MSIQKGTTYLVSLNGTEEQILVNAFETSQNRIQLQKVIYAKEYEVNLLVTMFINDLDNIEILKSLINNYIVTVRKRDFYMQENERNYIG